MKRLSILGSDSARLATVSFFGGMASVDAVDPRLKARLVELFNRDFDESVGFPPRRVRARAQSLPAFEAAVEYVQKTLGLACSLVVLCGAESPVETRDFLPKNTTVVGTTGAGTFTTFVRPRRPLAQPHA